MIIAVKIFLFICLFFIIYQDFKQRAISWYLIPLLLLGFGITGIIEHGTALVLKGTGLNVAFVLIQLVLLSVYMSLKNKRFVNVIDTYIGLGDVLFFGVLATAFSPFNFVVFYITTTILTLLGFLVYSIIRRSSKEIPLAGAMATMMVVVMVMNLFLPSVDFHNDSFFIACFTTL